jgi:multidrug efflux pump subunit AcrB
MKLLEKISIKRPCRWLLYFTILILGLFSYLASLGYELIPKFEQNVVLFQPFILELHQVK